MLWVFKITMLSLTKIFLSLAVLISFLGCSMRYATDLECVSIEKVGKLQIISRYGENWRRHLCEEDNLIIQLKTKFDFVSHLRKNSIGMLAKVYLLKNDERKLKISSGPILIGKEHVYELAFIDKDKPIPPADEEDMFSYYLVLNNSRIEEDEAFPGLKTYLKEDTLYFNIVENPDDITIRIQGNDVIRQYYSKVVYINKEQLMQAIQNGRWQASDTNPEE